MSVEALTRVELDASRPDLCPTDVGLLFSPTCHVDAKFDVWYRDGVLWLKCGQCAQVVTRIAVAAGIRLVTS